MRPTAILADAAAGTAVALKVAGLSTGDWANIAAAVAAAFAVANYLRQWFRRPSACTCATCTASR